MLAKERKRKAGTAILVVSCTRLDLSLTYGQTFICSSKYALTSKHRINFLDLNKFTKLLIPAPLATNSGK